MTPQEEKNLEKLVSAAVRNLPSRPAPGSLELRVQAEIARRAALPWWRRSFAHWPMAARAVFVLISGVVIKLVMSGLVWVTAGVRSETAAISFAPERRWLDAGHALLTTATDFAGVLVGSVSPWWIYGALAVVAGLYATLFGLGAAAYRTLYVNR